MIKQKGFAIIPIQDSMLYSLLSPQKNAIPKFMIIPTAELHSVYFGINFTSF